MNREVICFDAVAPARERGLKYEARVPIAAIDNVFELVKADIKNHTVPYNPSLDSAKDLATSATTEVKSQC